jgi:hypothetical protein
VFVTNPARPHDVRAFGHESDGDIDREFFAFDSRHWCAIDHELVVHVRAVDVSKHDQWVGDGIVRTGLADDHGVFRR